jgi:chemotaxis protein histidine kinase CheA
MGSTILGDGKPAFILDIKELFSSDHKNTAKKVA